MSRLVISPSENELTKMVILQINNRVDSLSGLKVTIPLLEFPFAGLFMPETTHHDLDRLLSDSSDDESSHVLLWCRQRLKEGPQAGYLAS